MNSGSNYTIEPIEGLNELRHLSMVRRRNESATIPGFFDNDIDRTLAEHGALLFRDFPVSDDEGFADLVASLAREQLRYQERSTKRTRKIGNVYTSTEYPAEKSIASHSENSFQLTIPSKILFFAKRPAETGGETPFASNARILEDLEPDVLDELQRRGVRYIRNFDGGFDLSWQEAFQTDDRAEVESYCHRNAINFTWITRDHLRTAQTRSATRRHPLTGVEVWFNQLHLFHSSNLNPAMRAALVESFGTAGLPRHATFGDGGEMGDELVDHLRSTITTAEAVFPWRTGDVLIGDNMLVSHGRKPFTGVREILVALIDPIELPKD